MVMTACDPDLRRRTRPSVWTTTLPKQAIERLHRGVWPFGASPYTRRNGQKIGSGFNQRSRIFYRDAADGDAGHHHQIAPPAKDFRIGDTFRLLGLRRIERAEGHII